MDKPLPTPRTKRAAPAKRQKRPEEAWSELGGTTHILQLSYEHARKRFYRAQQPVQVCLKLSELTQGPGMLRVIGRDAEDVAYSVWLFPDGNGTYLDDSVLLRFFSDTPIWLSMTCWESNTAGNYFIEQLQKPSVEPK